LTASLKTKTIHALSWSFIETIGLQGTHFIIGVILARLLLPEQFGLIAMLSIFMAVAQSLLDSGFGSALIQKQDITQTDLSSVFYFNILIGIAAAGLLSISAPYIATFYNQPELIALTRAMSLIIVINSFSLIQYTLAAKNLNFKTITKVSVLSNVISGIIGISMAYNGFGVWSLVSQQISRSFLSAILLWIFNSWRPSLSFSIKSLKNMFGYGSRMLASGLLNQIFNNLHLLVIGRIFTAASLGFFTRAKSLSELPAQSITSMVGRVTFPVFSSIQDDIPRIKNGMKKALTTLALITFPIMIGLAVTARPVVLLLFTDKWAESIPYVRLLSIIGMLYPLHVINLNILQALGRSDLFFRLEVIKKILIVINIAVTWRWGIMAMIYGMLVISIISYYFNSYYNKFMIKYSFTEQLFDLLPYIIISSIMGLSVYSFELIHFKSILLLLICQITSGLIIYLLLCRIFQVKAFMDLLRTVLNKINLPKNKIITSQEI